MSTPGIILELSGVTRRFGGLIAVNDLSMQVIQGSIHGLIGPNGAGKSTAFDLVSGLTRVSAGEIRLLGQDITRTTPEQRVKLGICRTFQTPRLFEQMSVLETVMTGAHLHGRVGFFGSLFLIGGKARDEAALRQRACELIELVGLTADAHTQVSQLSYGKRRLVEIARALATDPKLLLLDEVASGLNPSETAGVGALIRSLAAAGITVVIVEHDMRFVMELCQQITVLNFGSRIGQGTADVVSRDQDVITAYLGQPRSDGVSRRAARHEAMEMQRDRNSCQV